MKHVLDASATLAVIFEETGADAVAMALRSGAAMSTVNAAEVSARLHQDRWTDPEVELVFEKLGIELLPFGSEVAMLSGKYRIATRHLGLGLGDRACLATARLEKCPALTADQSWQQLELVGVDIRCIR